MSDDTVSRLTAAVREADACFERVGGSSRHYVADCLLPALDVGRLAVVDALVPRHLEAAERDVDSLSLKLDLADATNALLREALEAHEVAEPLRFHGADPDDCDFDTQGGQRDCPRCVAGALTRAALKGAP